MFNTLLLSGRFVGIGLVRGRVVGVADLLSIGSRGGVMCRCCRFLFSAENHAFKRGDQAGLFLSWGFAAMSLGWSRLTMCHLTMRCLAMRALPFLGFFLGVSIFFRVATFFLAFAFGRGKDRLSQGAVSVSLAIMVLASASGISTRSP